MFYYKGISLFINRGYVRSFKKTCRVYFLHFTYISFNLSVMINILCDNHDMNKTTLMTFVWGVPNIEIMNKAQKIINKESPFIINLNHMKNCWWRIDI